MHFENVHSEVFKQKCDEAVAAVSGNANTIGFKIRRLEFIQHLTDIVTVNGRPFMCLNDSGVVGLAARDADMAKA